MASQFEIRQRFAEEPENRIVSAEVYISQLTGRDRLIRSDEPEANLLGLRDEDTGNRILVPAEEFARRQYPGR